ncbi:EF-hand calcium-binding domain-containing protein 3 [Dendropsophus ebraccatus]|uniref:EF-hand calcium-binding domain-containing protein 3 n=1 Tax=Dendropsophus ebraccatus TaxID=150705 RepID=UPI0038314FE5
MAENPPKVSVHRDFLKSTRVWKWWKVSRENKEIVADHKVSEELTILEQSSQMLQTAKIIQYYVSPELREVKEIFPDVTLKSDLVEAFQNAFEFFRKDKTKRVDMNDLQYSLSTMGIHLNHHDTYEALKSADIDGDKKVNFYDFLAVLTDDQRFSITIDRRWLLPVLEQEYLGTVLFHAISRLLQKCSLPRRSAAEISNYYQKKYEATPKPPKLQGSKSKVMVDFARGTRIMGMTDRQLVHYLDEIKALKGSCVGSPYDVIPCVPLCTSMETILSVQPDITRLMLKNIYKGDKVNLGKKRFSKGTTGRKVSSTPHFWDKIQGGQIEQQTRSPKLCTIFSIYSWFWDAQNELLAQKKLWQQKKTALAQLGTDTQRSNVARNWSSAVKDQGEWKASDTECTDVLNELSQDPPKSAEDVQK